MPALCKQLILVYKVLSFQHPMSSANVQHRLREITMATKTSFSKIQEFRGEQILDSGKEKSRLLWAEKKCNRDAVPGRRNGLPQLQWWPKESLYPFYLDYPWDTMWHCDRQYVQWLLLGRQELESQNLSSTTSECVAHSKLLTCRPQLSCLENKIVL